LAELLHGTIYFLEFYETKFGIFVEFFALATLGVKGLNKICEVTSTSDPNLWKYNSSKHPCQTRLLLYAVQNDMHQKGVF